MSVFIEEKEYHLVPGDLAFVFPEQLHAIDSPISSWITIIQFSPELTGHFSTRYQKQIPEDPILSGVFYPADRLQFTNIYEKKSFLYYLCALLTAHTDFIPLSNHTTPPFCLLSYVGRSSNRNVAWLKRQRLQVMIILTSLGLSKRRQESLSQNTSINTVLVRLLTCFLTQQIALVPLLSPVVLIRLEVLTVILRS